MNQNNDTTFIEVSEQQIQELNEYGKLFPIGSKAKRFKNGLRYSKIRNRIILEKSRLFLCIHCSDICRILFGFQFN